MRQSWFDLCVLLSLLLAACAAPYTPPIGPDPALTEVTVAPNTAAADRPEATATRTPTMLEATKPPRPPELIPQPVVRIRQYGGLCPGSALCQSVITIYTDGSYELVEYDLSQSIGTLDAAEVQRVAELAVSTSFEALRARPFEGTCPTAYDGQARAYTFYAGGSVEELDSCETEIPSDSALFRSVEALVAEVWQQANAQDG